MAASTLIVTLVAFLLILKPCIKICIRRSLELWFKALLFFLVLNGVEIHRRRFQSNSVFTNAVQCTTMWVFFSIKAFLERKPVANTNNSYSSWFYVFICPIKITYRYSSLLWYIKQVITSLLFLPNHLLLLHIKFVMEWLNMLFRLKLTTKKLWIINSSVQWSSDWCGYKTSASKSYFVIAEQNY